MSEVWALQVSVSANFGVCFCSKAVDFGHGCTRPLQKGFVLRRGSLESNLIFLMVSCL